MQCPLRHIHILKLILIEYQKKIKSRQRDVRFREEWEIQVEGFV
jgi:hypothetical protein